MTLVFDVSRSLVRVARDRALHGPRHHEWGFVAEVAADVMRQGAIDNARATFEELRAFVDRQTPPAVSTLRFRLQRDVLGGVPIVRLTPRFGKSRGVLLFLHGGGYVFGSMRTHGELCAAIAASAGAAAVFVDYRLAPEHPFPAAYDDVFAVYRALLAETPASRVVVGGDSAGAGLAVALAMRLRDEREPNPAGLALICPWADPTRMHGSVAANGDFDWIPAAERRRYVEAYAGDVATSDPRITVLRGDLRGLPETLVQFGGAELMTDEARELAAAMRAAGVHVECDEVPGMIHDFQLLAAALPAGRHAIRRLGEFVRARTA